MSAGKTLSDKELAELGSIPDTAVAAFKEAAKGHRAILDNMLKAVRMSVESQVGNDRWLALGYRSQEKVLKSIFEQARKIMRVGDEDGSGMAKSTFNTYSTRIKRVMVFHVALEDSHLSNAALDQAFQTALSRRGGSLEKRMAAALAEWKKKPEWKGHPLVVPPLAPSDTGPLLNVINLPEPGKAESPRHLIKLGLQQFLEWAAQEDVRDALAEDDKELKQVRMLVRELRDVYATLEEKPVSAAA